MTSGAEGKWPLSDEGSDPGPRARHSGAAEVFGAFLKLGLTSFGGPVAHLGYFRDELVVRRRWLGDEAYGDLVALCQFLPGPASSQVGFALGLLRAGWGGALAAFVGFTLPSALILLVFASGAASVSGPIGDGALRGLKIVAVAIVAQAVWGMARVLCPDRVRAAIAAVSVVLLAFVPGAVGIGGAIMLGGAAGLAFCRGEGQQPDSGLAWPVSRSAGIAAISIFLVLLVVLPLLAGGSHLVAVFDSFYRAGALVFGGGHVVLPLLDAEVVQRGWVTPDDFLAGYGAAQAVPGPLFTFAAYLGAVLAPPSGGLLGAAIALTAIFLPGFLLLIAALPLWAYIRTRPTALAFMKGANSAVVGVLAAALYAPVFTTVITGPREFAVALAGFVALTAWSLPPWIVVAVSALAGIGLTLTAA